MDKCCCNCFNDKIINAYIEKESEEFGKCSFCNSENVKIITPDILTDTFETLLDLYKESGNSDSKTLAELIQQDWDLFFDAAVATNLLPKILEYTESKKYIHADMDKLSADIWEDFREEIKHNNRFFPKTTADLDGIKLWLNELATTDYPSTVYRARISEDKENPLSSAETGKPPKLKATGGRANPVGISYLYTATNIETAIAEIRPHKGDFVTIAKLTVPTNSNLVDLRKPKNSLSPFSYADDDDMLKKLFQNIELLERLSDELSKPILPREAHLEYLPSQYLAELIKDSGFDGILYKSSVGDGDNIALFSDADVVIEATKLYEITNLTFENKKIDTTIN